MSDCIDNALKSVARGVLGHTGEPVFASDLRLIGQTIKHGRYVIAFSHSDYRTALGGTEKLLTAEQLALDSRGVSYIHICGKGDEMPCTQRDLTQRVYVQIDSIPAGRFSISYLSLLLRYIALDGGPQCTAVHVHHFMHMAVLGISNLVANLAPPVVRFFLHDYFTICPQFNLMRNDIEYCGDLIADNPDACRGCRYRLHRGDHYMLMRFFLEDFATEIVSPSESAAEVLRRHVTPDVSGRIRIVPHQQIVPSGEAPFAPPDRFLRPGYRPRMAYVGAQTSHKGFDAWRGLIEMGIRKQFDLYHLGHWAYQLPGVRYVPVSYINDGHDAMISTLREQEIDIAFLWSMARETYSFTLFESVAAGCFIVTNPSSGNIAAYVRRTGCGIVCNTIEEAFAQLSNMDSMRQTLADYAKRSIPSSLPFNGQIADEVAARELPPLAVDNEALSGLRVRLTLEAVANESLNRNKARVSVFYEDLTSMKARIECLSSLLAEALTKDKRI